MAFQSHPARDLLWRPAVLKIVVVMRDKHMPSERKKVEMPFAHLKRILKLDRLRLRGPCGARGEFLLAAAAQNLKNGRADAGRNAAPAG